MNKTAARRRAKLLKRLRHAIQFRFTGEQLMNLAYERVSGDPLCKQGRTSGISPDHIDETGTTKAAVYDAAMSNNMRFFDGMASQVNGNGSSWLISKRTYVTKDGRKPRPIDVPSNAKYLVSDAILRQLQALADALDWMEPTVIGFRGLDEFRQFCQRMDGVTPQDVFASTVHQLVKEHGPYVVSVDLQDAYGNLPLQAIQTALEAAGLCHDTRRRIVELVRIRTVLPNGSLLKPKSYGIEQGSVLGPLVFNIVMSFILRGLRTKGIQAACYGDDVALVAKTDAEAKAAFQAFHDVALVMGFKNVRPLGMAGEKATRIFDTNVEPAPLIRTFLVDGKKIALIKDKAEELRSRLPKNPSLKKVRKANKWKVTSKTTIKAIIQGDANIKVSEGSSGQPDTERNEAKSPAAPSLDPDLLHPPLRRSLKPGDKPASKEEVAGEKAHQDVISHDQPKDTIVPIRDNPPTGNVAMEEAEAEYSPRLSPGYADASERELEGTFLTVQLRLGSVRLSTMAASSVGEDKAGTADNGRMSAPKGGSVAGVSSGANGGQGWGSRPCPPGTVLRLDAQDVAALSEGRRLRGGDRYRGAMIDVRNLVNEVGQSQIKHAIGQVCRTASVHGLAKLLAHPADSWMWDELTLAGLSRLKDQQRPNGIVITLRRPGKVRTPRRRVGGGHRPPADLVIQETRRSRTDAMIWTVRAKEAAGADRRIQVRASTPNAMIGRTGAIASALKSGQPSSVSIPVRALPARLMLGGSQFHIRHVGLARAMRMLQAWTWRQDGAWLVGQTRSPRP